MSLKPEVKKQVNIVKELVDAKYAKGTAEEFHTVKGGCLVTIAIAANRVSVVVSISNTGKIMTHGDYHNVFSIDADINNYLNLEITAGSMLVVYHGLTPLRRVGINNNDFGESYAKALDLIMEEDLELLRGKLGLTAGECVWSKLYEINELD